MMSDFNQSNELGKIGEGFIMEALRKVYSDVRETPKNINVQMEWADIVCVGNPAIGIPHKKIEVKTERKHTGNLFWETWSDKPKGRKGWGVTSTADELFYLFLDDRIGYRVESLQSSLWLFDYCRKEYKEVQQTKAQQANETWGCLVPVDADWLRAIPFTLPETITSEVA